MPATPGNHGKVPHAAPQRHVPFATSRRCRTAAGSVRSDAGLFRMAATHASMESRREVVRRTGSGSPSMRMGRFAWWDVRPTSLLTCEKVRVMLSCLGRSWVQWVVATLPCWQEHRNSFSASAGVFQPSVLRGRPLSAAATASRSPRWAAASTCSPAMATAAGRWPDSVRPRARPALERPVEDRPGPGFPASAGAGLRASDGPAAGQLRCNRLRPARTRAAGLRERQADQAGQGRWFAKRGRLASARTGPASGSATWPSGSSPRR